jgi:hypothetical protein
VVVPVRSNLVLLTAAVRLWFATNYIGAVWVPAITAYTGALLAHMQKILAPRSFSYMRN